MKNYLLKWTNEGPELIEIDEEIITLERIHQYIDELIDYVSYVDLGNPKEKYEIIVDDSGLLKKLPVTFNVIDIKNQEMCAPLVGTALIVKVNDKGETLALNYRDISYIFSSVYYVDGQFYVLLDNQEVENQCKILKEIFGNVIKF